MSGADTFNQVMNPYGGRFDLTKVSSDEKYFFEGGIRRARMQIETAKNTFSRALSVSLTATGSTSESNWPAMHVDIVDNPLVFVVTECMHSEYYIGISSGTFAVINKYVFRMLSDARVLTHIGNVSLEKDSLPLFPRYGSRMSVKFYMDDPSKCPNDIDRIQYSELLIGIITDFLMGREITIIIHGHIRFLHDLSNRSALQKHMVGSLSDLTCNALEIDADTGAVRLCRLWRDLRLSAMATHEYSVSLKRAAFDYMYAIYVFFRLFGDDSEVGSYPKTTESYPPLQTRLLNALIEFMGAMPNDMDKNIFSRSSMHAFDQAEHAFMTIVEHKSLSGQYVPLLWDPGNRQLRKCIVDHRNAISISLLAPRSYGMLTDYTADDSLYYACMSSEKDLKPRRNRAGDSDPSWASIYLFKLAVGSVSAIAMFVIISSMIYIKVYGDTVHVVSVSRSDERSYLKDQVDIANSHDAAGNRLFLAHRFDESLASYKRASEIWQSLAVENPSRIDYWISLAYVNRRISKVCINLHRPAEAYDAYESALDILRNRTAMNDVDDQVNGRYSRRIYRDSDDIIGEMQVSIGKPFDAIAS